MVLPSPLPLPLYGSKAQRAGTVVVRVAWEIRVAGGGVAVSVVVQRLTTCAVTFWEIVEMQCGDPLQVECGAEYEGEAECVMSLQSSFAAGLSTVASSRLSMIGAVPLDANELSIWLGAQDEKWRAHLV